jgi:nitrogen regulatory protein P-II 1
MARMAAPPTGRAAMKKIEAIIEPFKLDEVRASLVGAGIAGMTISEVKRVDPQVHGGWYRGSEYVVWFAPRIKIEVVVPDGQADLCVGALRRGGASDEPDEGTIVVLPVDDAIRIRAGGHLRPAA